MEEIESAYPESSFLSKFSVQDLLNTKKPRPVVQLKSNVKVQDALKVLSDNDILSVPVYDVSLKAYHILDICDFVSGLMNVHGNDLESVKLEFFNTTLDKIWDNDWESLVTISPEHSLHSAAVNLGTTSHRCVVLKDDQAIAIVSQSDIIRFASTISLSPEMLNHKAADLMTTELESIPEEATAAQAFLNMDILHSIMRVRGTPILSKDGRLIEVISGSDLRGLRNQNFSDLELPVLEFKKKSPCKDQMTTCAPDLSFLDILNLFVKKHIHSLFVLEDGRPIGVITATDIIFHIIEYN